MLNFDTETMLSPDVIPLPSNPDEIPLPNEITTRPPSPEDIFAPGPSGFQQTTKSQGVKQKRVEMPPPEPLPEISGDDLEQFLAMNRNLQKAYSEQIRLLRQRQISIQTEMLALEAQLAVLQKGQILSDAGIRMRDSGKFKPGHSLRYFQKPYFFDRKTKTSCYTDSLYHSLTAQEGSDGAVMSVGNVLNEKRERLFPFRADVGEQTSLNYKQEQLLKRIIRKDIEFRMRLRLKDSVIAEGETKLAGIKAKFAADEITLEQFEERRDEQTRDTKKRLKTEIENIAKMEDVELFEKIENEELDWSKIAMHIRNQARALNVKSSRYNARDVLAEDETCEDVQPHSLALAWRNRLHPKINRDAFKGEEIARLVAMREGGNKSWTEIAAELSSVGKMRTPLQCIAAFQREKMRANIPLRHTPIERFKLSRLLSRAVEPEEPGGKVRFNFIEHFHNRHKSEFYRRRITWGKKSQLNIAENVNRSFTDAEDVELAKLAANGLAENGPLTRISHLLHEKRTEIEIRYRLLRQWGETQLLELKYF